MFVFSCYLGLSCWLLVCHINPPHCLGCMKTLEKEISGDEGKLNSNYTSIQFGLGKNIFGCVLSKVKVGGQ